jgi:hypothetical protein
MAYADLMKEVSKIPTVGDAVALTVEIRGMEMYYLNEISRLRMIVIALFGLWVGTMLLFALLTW